MVVHPQPLAVDAKDVRVPAQALLAPVVERLLVLMRTYEVFHLHQLELADAKNEIPGCDLVAERFALLRDAERHAHPRRADHVLEVDEHPLRGLGAQIDLRRAIFQRADVRLEHQVEHAGVVQCPAALRTFLAQDLVGAPALLALAQALPERIDEVLEMAGGFPHRLRHHQRRLQADHVVSQLDHVTPPQVADRPLQGDPVRAVVVEARQAAVDLARRVDEPPALG